MVLGAPTSVVSSALPGPTGVDEQVSAVLGFEGGAQAVVSASLRAHLPSDAEIVGTRGRIHLHAPLYRPHRLSVAGLGGPSAPPAPRLSEGATARLLRHRWIRAAGLRAQGLLEALGLGGRRTILPALEGNGYNYEAAEAMRCLAEGRTESAILPLQETLRVQETLDAIRRAWA
jgi:predicted dehydrogenase